ncbi:GT-D fold domain-containing glycosyltransferase [Clostridium formicaceticum]|uniref:GT-D fold-like domain-containing protein n=1 Tax=Clostridium formicaceticum TaxID=1497 RepID=A0AAC9WG65_9CLOT|nr:GT-D fold domain-containing glycosyltransferase [Clostridium formicaceticum]AOY76992.1 hypothetical protein BJL90_14685 [Clostridium formicaceticum]ARE87479.1 hypothetical protein CLFO_18790 [Clostridium formicaceticum]
MIKEESLLSADEVIEKMYTAYRNKQGLSIVRLGDGEALALAQEVVLRCDEIKKRKWLPYAGLTVPDLKARDELVASVKKADIVGVAMNELPDFTPLLIKVFEAHQINTNQKVLTNACINYFLMEKQRLKKFLLQSPKPRVFLIGNKVDRLVPYLTREGIRVVGLLRAVRGLKDCSKIVKLTSLYRNRFDIVLVSAGIPAVIISERIAKEYSTITLDFGHAADLIIKRKYF